jgi:hypothetical protein
MLRKMIALFAGVTALALVFGAGVSAQDEKKEEKKGEKKTLEGTLVCGKCKLSETDECSNALLVTKDDKEIKYWLKDDGKKAKYHKCSGEKKVKVTGIVKEVEVKGEKKMVIEPEKKGEPIKVEDVK